MGPRHSYLAGLSRRETSCAARDNYESRLIAKQVTSPDIDTKTRPGAGFPS